jgi:hypothetical protein
MKIFLKTFVSVLLLVNGIGALFGGWNMITHPDGSSLKMPLEMLQHSPFLDYFIPGIILLTANGLFSLFTLVALLLKNHLYPKLIVAQGVILAGWILIQCIMLQAVHFLHILFWCIGVMLIISGWMLKEMRMSKLNIS